MRVAILMHNKIRDLPSAVDLKLELEARGHAATVLPVGWYPPLRAFAPDVIVVPDCVNGVTRDAMDWAHAQNIVVVTLHAEGAIMPVFEEAWAGVGLDPTVEAGIIVWGEQGREALLRHQRVPEQIHVCGNPRFDKYFRPLQTKEEFCPKHGLDPKKPLVFYAANLQWVRGVVYDEYDYTFLKDAKKTLEHLVELRYATNEVFFRLVANHPELNFVLKPHPGDDDPQEYVDEIRRRGLKNLVFLHGEYDIADLLSVSDIVLHWNTTASTEGWFLGKPTISMHFDAAVDYMLSDFITGSDLVRKEADLERVLQHYLRGGKIPKAIQAERDRFVRRWYGPTDGRSTERVADAIEASHRRSARPTVKRVSKAERRSAAVFLVKRLFGRPPHKRLLPFQKPYPDVPAPSELRAWEDRLRPYRPKRPARGSTT